jgi:hypothetical protein
MSEADNRPKIRCKGSRPRAPLNPSDGCASVMASVTTSGRRSPTRVELLRHVPDISDTRRPLARMNQTLN